MTGSDPFWRHADLDPVRLRRLIVSGVIILAGNERLRIYGQLSCRSGKRMHRGNRVFLPMRMPRWEQGFAPAAIVCETPICVGGKSGQLADLMTARIWQLPVNWGI